MLIQSLINPTSLFCEFEKKSTSGELLKFIYRGTETPTIWANLIQWTQIQPHDLPANLRRISPNNLEKLLDNSYCKLQVYDNGDFSLSLPTRGLGGRPPKSTEETSENLLYEIQENERENPFLEKLEIKNEHDFLKVIAIDRTLTYRPLSDSENLNITVGCAGSLALTGLAVGAVKGGYAAAAGGVAVGAAQGAVVGAVVGAAIGGVAGGCYYYYIRQGWAEKGKDLVRKSDKLSYVNLKVIQLNPKLRKLNKEHSSLDKLVQSYTTPKYMADIAQLIPSLQKKFEKECKKNTEKLEALEKEKKHLTDEASEKFDEFIDKFITNSVIEITSTGKVIFQESTELGQGMKDYLIGGEMLFHYLQYNFIRGIQLANELPNESPSENSKYDKKQFFNSIPDLINDLYARTDKLLNKKTPGAIVLKNLCCFIKAQHYFLISSTMESKDISYTIELDRAKEALNEVKPNSDKRGTDEDDRTAATHYQDAQTIIREKTTRAID